MKESICILDLCGTYRGISCDYWADYFFEDKKTVFGGILSWSVPDMKTSDPPTEEEAFAWIKKHLGDKWIEKALKIYDEELEKYNEIQSNHERNNSN